MGESRGFPEDRGQATRAFFGEFTLDCASRQLLRGTAECVLEPKAFDLLELLVTRHPEAVPKHEIHRLLWPDTFVSDSSLTGLVVQVRQALGDDPRQPRFIRTVHRFGYAFSGDVSRQCPGATREPSLIARVWWEGRSFGLVAGENILGRDKRAAACIAAPGVSRRHARILLGGAKRCWRTLRARTALSFANYG